MNLDNMIQEVALYVGETIPKNGTTYTGNRPNIIVSGINYAISKIVSERWKLYYTETVILDSELSFDISSLTYTFLRVKSLKDIYGNDINYKINGTKVITNSDVNPGDSLILEYSYKPDELTLANITANFPLPEQNVNPRIVCFFAAYFYYDTKSDDRAVLWLDKWNDGYISIIQPVQIESIIDVYGGVY